MNSVYVTPEAAEEKMRCDAEVDELERRGQVSK